MDPIDELCGFVDAAAALIDGAAVHTVATPHCDRELWTHIEPLVAGTIWDKVPAAVVTFVEDWFRRAAGDPPNKRGGRLYGAGLFAELLKPGGRLALGSDTSEIEGRRDLGVGLAKAIGNGHRHAIRSDGGAEEVAWGVIGVGSLLIGEARRTHGEP